MDIINDVVAVSYDSYLTRTIWKYFKPIITWNLTQTATRDIAFLTYFNQFSPIVQRCDGWMDGQSVAGRATLCQPRRLG